MRNGMASLFLVLCMLFAAGSAQTVPARAQNTPTASASAGGLDVVQATYDNLFLLFYRPLDPSSLLDAGWSALGRAADQQNLPDPPPLPSLPAGQDEAFATFASAYSTYLQGLPMPPSGPNLGFVIANGMATSINEDHTNFLPPASYQDFLSSLGGGALSVGFGVRLTGTAPRIVTAVAPNGPADQAGMLVGDSIVAVDGADVSSADGQTFAQETGGPAGTVHSLTLDRAGASLTVSVARGSYYFPPLTSKLLANGVGYVDLEHFPDAGLTLPDGTEILSDFDRQVNALTAEGATGLVLDLRGNGGGDTLAAEEILGRFLSPETETVIRFDERGNSATGMVAGAMLATQLPLVVLVDGGSASSSELVASTLQENNRALLVGEQTAGALATSEILPLPEGAGLQIAVAEQVTAKDHVQIDGTGVSVDIQAPDTRTSDDYRNQRDPQLDAAVAALASAPDPAAATALATVSKDQIAADLSASMPDPTQIPTNDRLGPVMRTETLELNQPNEWIDAFGFGGRDPVGLKQRMQQRGWIGTLLQNYNAQPLVPPTISIVFDEYATPGGAQDALTTNDFPDEQNLLASPIQLGDGSVEVQGIWLDLGGISISWRRGDTVISVGYGDVPGFENINTVEAIAQQLDQSFAANPPALLPGQSP